MTWLALYRQPEDRWHSECDHGSFVLALQSGNIQNEKNLWLRNILVVKDIWELCILADDRKDEKFNNCSRSQFTFLYRNLMAHKRKSTLFLRFRFYAFEDAERASWSWEIRTDHVYKTSLSWKRICFYFLNYFLLRSRWLTLKLWACTFMSADPLYKILFTTCNEIQRRVKVWSSTTGII